MSHDVLLSDQEIRRLQFARGLYEAGTLNERDLRDEDGQRVPDPDAVNRGARRARAMGLLAWAAGQRAC